MSHDIESYTDQFTESAEHSFTADPTSRGPRSTAPKLLQNVITFCSFALVSMVISTAAIWWFNREKTSNASADAFLWFAGQNQTWDEYQKKQKSAGRQRMDEKEYDWTQQLFNDAYNNR
jgi:hypothetical protein